MRITVEIRYAIMSLNVPISKVCISHIKDTYLDTVTVPAVEIQELLCVRDHVT